MPLHETTTEVTPRRRTREPSPSRARRGEPQQIAALVDEAGFSLAEIEPSPRDDPQLRQSLVLPSWRQQPTDGVAKFMPDDPATGPAH